VSFFLALFSSSILLNPAWLLSAPKFDSAMPSSGGTAGASNKGKEIKISLIDQTTSLDKGGVTRTISEDIMHHPTVGGKVYAASTYGLQMMLAAGGLVVFGGIGYSLFGNVAKKTGPTRMFGYAMDRLNKHPQVEINLGMPIKGDSRCFNADSRCFNADSRCFNAESRHFHADSRSY